MAKTFAEIERDLKNKIYHPFYILEGEEPYYNELLVKHFEENILSESEKGFNLHIVFGKDVNDKKIVQLANSFPMFGNYSIVIVKEAQMIKDWSALAAAIKSIPKTTILVLFFANASLDKRTTDAKQLVAHAVVHTGKRLKDSEIEDFIAAQFKKSKHQISPQNVKLLADHVNHDLSFIMNEISKLVMNIPAGEEITAAHIERFIGINKDYNVFALTKALGLKQHAEALRIAEYIARNTKEFPPQAVLPQLNNYFQKILMYRTLAALPRNERASAMGVNPYFLDEYERAAANYSNSKLFQVIETISEFDLRSKQIIENNTPDGELNREVVMRILN